MFYKFFMVVAVITIIILSLQIYVKQHELMYKINRGDLLLHCAIGDGYKVIEPSKIKYYADNTWIFTNGYASNCLLTDVNKQ